MNWARRYFASIDPRTLGLFRIALALLLLFDLARRIPGIELWYTDSGLLPGHVNLWRPSRPWQFSFFFALARPLEVGLGFALCAVSYAALLVGYRTRVAQVLSLICIISLQTRVDILSNGGDFAICVLSWWTVFMPLGRRFSVDAVLGSLRERKELSSDALSETAALSRDTAPFESLAVVGASLQLAVIYLFNALHKSGATWMDGSAVHLVLQQERIITAVGLWARAHMTPEISRCASWSTLFVEGSLPLLILSPVGRPWTRRLAIVFIVLLHVGIAVLMNFGIFSPVMIVFATLLVSPEDWDVLARLVTRRKKRLVVHFDDDCGVCFAAARLLVRLDALGRIDLAPISARRDLPAGFDPTMLERTMLVVERDSGRYFVRGAALSRIVLALPFGSPVAWGLRLPLVSQAVAALYDRVALNRMSISAFFGWTACGTGTAAGSGALVAEPSPARLEMRNGLATLRESLLILLLVVAGSQVLAENWAVPQALRPTRVPTWVEAAVSYGRIQQGWGMFAPEAPKTERSVVVDARTEDGRHVDPYNERAARIADPTLRSVPMRPDYDVYWVDYTMRIAERDQHHSALRDWIFAYHERTGRHQDRIVAFEAFVVEQDSPGLGETQPENVRHRRFLAGRR
jgi:predicted DCC family thiol-disulfide oxidoreductase YuxK